jgi:outer membrane immunogenic protein
MKNRIILCVSGLLTMVAAHADAADAVMDPDPIPIVNSFNWGGAYIGGEVGYGFGRTRFSEAMIGNLRPRGILGGGYAGYNFDIGNNIILGVDGDFSGAGVDRTASIVSGSVSGDYKSALRWSGAIRPRIGYAMDRFLPYIAGGVAFGQIRDSLTLQATSTSAATSDSQSRTKTGWTIGGRYTDFGNRTINFNGVTEDFKQKLTTHDIRLGVAYKF